MFVADFIKALTVMQKLHKSFAAAEHDSEVCNNIFFFRHDSAVIMLGMVPYMFYWEQLFIYSDPHNGSEQTKLKLLQNMEAAGQFPLQLPDKDVPVLIAMLKAKAKKNDYIHMIDRNADGGLALVFTEGLVDFPAVPAKPRIVETPLDLYRKMVVAPCVTGAVLNTSGSVSLDGVGMAQALTYFASRKNPKYTQSVRMTTWDRPVSRCNADGELETVIEPGFVSLRPSDADYGAVICVVRQN